MRLKLVIIASVIAALVGAGSAVALILFFLNSPESLTRPGPVVAATYLLPILVTFFASMFVYRHTARRRKLQAALTAMISLLLSLSVFLISSVMTARTVPTHADPPLQQRNAG